jgi:hypothetical protein
MPEAIAPSAADSFPIWSVQRGVIAYRAATVPASSEETTSPRSSYRALVVAVSIAAVIGVAELPFAAFMADDLIQLGVLEGVMPRPWLGPFDLYTIADGVPEHVRAMQDAGALPWFFPADFKMAFLRPLSSATIALDHALWGLWPVGHRIHGIVWFIVLVAGVGLVFRRALPGAVGALALVVFTVSSIHGILVWNATRHVVIAGALGMLALAAHVRWRETGWGTGRILSVAGFALALCASEAALAVMAYLLAYEMLGARGPWDDRLRAGAPALVLVAGYLVAYRLAGFGASSALDYVDPLATPAAFLIELPGRWLFLFGALLGGVGADVWTLRRELRPLFIAGGAGIVIGFGIALRAVWGRVHAADRHGTRWLVAGAAVAAVPFAGTPIGARCLVLPMIGASAAIALVIHHWWIARMRSEATRRIVAVAGALLALVHLVGAPIGRLASPYVLRRLMHDRLEAVVHDTQLDETRLPSQRVVVLRAPDFMMGLYPFLHRTLYRLPMPRSWRALSWAPGTHRFTRTAVDTLELEIDEGAIGAPHVAPGQVIALTGMQVTVLASDRRGPTRVRFQLDRPLDDPDVVLLVWDADRFRQVGPPPIGGTLSIEGAAWRPA